MEKALILEYFTPDEIERIKSAAQGRCELLIAREDWTREQLIDAMTQADMILGSPEPEELEYCKKLKWMQVSWDGIGHYLDTGRFGEGCELYNMAGAYGRVISEFAIGAAVALLHKFPTYLSNMRTGHWEREPQHKTLEDSTVLILGAGGIGTEVAIKLRSFYCKSIIGMRRVKRECPKEFDEIIGMEQLDEYLEKADVVICALPGTKETAGLFNKERFLRMKKDAIFINVGRGPLVVSDDLAQVMQDGHLWGAALDITYPEPLPADHPLWKIPNLILTPHVSGNCFITESPTMVRIRRIMIESFEDRMAGRESKNKIDYKTGYRKI